MASYLPPVIHVENDIFSITDYNTLANNTAFIYQAPYISAYQSTPTILTNGTNVQVVLDTVLGSGYGCGLTSNAVVIPVEGVYVVSFAVSINGASGYLQAHATQNGTVVIYGQGGISNNANVSTSLGTALLSCAAGDAIALWGFQYSSGDQSSLDQSYFTFMNIYFIGSQE